jgi:hypothetical protein
MIHKYTTALTSIARCAEAQVSSARSAHPSLRRPSRLSTLRSEYQEVEAAICRMPGYMQPDGQTDCHAARQTEKKAGRLQMGSIVKAVTAGCHRAGTID